MDMAKEIPINIKTDLTISNIEMAFNAPPNSNYKTYPCSLETTHAYSFHTSLDLLSHLHSNWIIVFPIMEKYMIRIEFPLDDSITFNSFLVPAQLLGCASCCYGRTTCAPR